MACFDGLIGIRTACSVIEGSSGFSIEELGITCQEADSYINSEYENGQQLIEDKIAFAAKIVSQQIANNFASEVRTKSLLESQTLGDYQDNLQLQSTVAASYGGISVTLTNQSSYLNFFVGSVSLHVNTTGNVSVFVYNLITGELLDTIIVPCVAGQISTKVVNKTYSSNRQKLDVILVYDVSTIQSYKTQLSYSGCTSCNGYKYNNYYLTSSGVSIASADSKIRNSLEGQTHTFGLSINYSIQCSLDSWLCDSANLMALPILYKAAELIMGYATRDSNRNNSDSNIDYEKNKERGSFFASEFHSQMQATIGNIRLPKGDPCFTCKDPVRTAIILP